MAYPVIASGLNATTDRKNAIVGPLNTTGSTIIFAAIITTYFNGNPFTFTDSAGNTWSNIGPWTQTPSSSNHYILTNGEGWLWIYYCKNPVTSATHTFHLETSTNREPCLAVIAFEGDVILPYTYVPAKQLPVAALTQSVGNSGLSTKATLALGLTGLGYDGPSVHTWAANNGFTIQEQHGPQFPSNGLAFAYRYSEDPVTAQITFTYGAAEGFSPMLATFEVQIATPLSGVYKLTPGKRHDTYYTQLPALDTTNFKIPDPSATTALFGDE